MAISTSALSGPDGKAPPNKRRKSGVASGPSDGRSVGNRSEAARSVPAGKSQPGPRDPTVPALSCGANLEIARHWLGGEATLHGTQAHPAQGARKSLPWCDLTGQQRCTPIPKASAPASFGSGLDRFGWSRQRKTEPEAVAAVDWVCHKPASIHLQTIVSPFRSPLMSFSDRLGLLRQ